VTALNPSRLTVTVYVPGATFGNAYAPVAPVSCSRTAPVCVFLRVTCAPNTTALLISVTVPTTTADVEVCACNAALTPNNAINSATTYFTSLTRPPPADTIYEGN